MRFLIFLFLLFITFFSHAQIFKFSTSKAKQKLVSVIIYYSDFAYYVQKDTVFDMQNSKVNVIIPYSEPQFVRIVCNWESRRQTKIKFLAISNRYTIIADQNLKLSIEHRTRSLFYQKYLADENKKELLIKEQNNLIDQINFNESEKLIRNRINKIKDSISVIIDEDNFKLYKTNLQNLFGLYALCQYAEYPTNKLRRNIIPDSIEYLFKRLKLKVQCSDVGIALKEKLDIAKTLLVGNKFNFDVLLKDTSGLNINLNLFKGKYLLIDFWATWCVPCRNEQPDHIQLFKKYKERNFQIISISLDELRRKRLWIETIHKDKINLWPHFSDFNSHARKIYNIKFIPANILISDKGIILARNLSSLELREKLKDVLRFKPN